MFTRNLILFAMLATSGVNVCLFLAKWIDSDFDSACKTFVDHIDNCLGKL